MSRFENIKNKQIIVYRHRRLDNYEVFYVGIASTLYRPYNKTSRNKFWKNIVSKTNYNVEIIATVEDWKTACELEEFLIQEYGRRDLKTGTLVNMTDGGDGRYGSIISESTKLKMSQVKLGIKKDKEIGFKISISKKGRKHSLEGKKKKVESLGKKVIDTSTGIIYESITEAAVKLNTFPSVISRYLADKVKKKKLNLKHLKTWEDTYNILH